MVVPVVLGGQDSESLTSNLSKASQDYNVCDGI